MSNDSANEWLQKLKPGDPVIRVNMYRQEEVMTVSKVTDTQIVLIARLGTALRFKKSTGSQIGAASHSCRILELTPHKMEAQAVFDLVCKIGSKVNIQPHQWQMYTADQLTRILAILEEGAEPK